MVLIAEGMRMGLSQESACRALGLSGRTYRNWKHAPEGDGRLKRVNYTNQRRISDEEREAIAARFCQPDVCDLSLPQAFYKLLDEKELFMCSLSSLYRIFRQKGLLGKRTPARSARMRYRPTSYSASKPNEVWTWDITYLRTSAYTGTFYYAYVIIDVYSRAVISARVFDADNAEYAAQFLLDAFNRHGIAPGQLVVHSDNGASMKSAKTLAVLKRYGVVFSHSRPRVSNDNPYSESLFRTMKYNGEYLYPRGGFTCLQEAQRWLEGFVYYYNELHRHRGIRMVTPGSRFRGEDRAILSKRGITMRRARQQAPKRWIQDRLLNCGHIDCVWLNPENGMLQEHKATGAA